MIKFMLRKFLLQILDSIVCFLVQFKQPVNRFGIPIHVSVYPECYEDKGDYCSDSEFHVVFLILRGAS